MTIGVLALQGDFKEHLHSLVDYGVNGLEVRTPQDLKKVDALILPGGESTTMAKLLVSTGLDKAIVKAAGQNLPIWGTCAGAILLSKKIISSVPLATQLNVLDVTMERNSYGRQTESFVRNVEIDRKKSEVFFIRSPRIRKVGKGVKILSRHGRDPVLVKSNHILASTFHSELRYPNPVLEYFLEKLVKGS